MFGFLVVLSGNLVVGMLALVQIRYFPLNAKPPLRNLGTLEPDGQKEL